jgi:hypothetical protein
MISAGNLANRWGTRTIDCKLNRILLKTLANVNHWCTAAPSQVVEIAWFLCKNLQKSCNRFNEKNKHVERYV